MADTSSLGGNEEILSCAFVGLAAVVCNTSPALNVHSASVFCYSCVSWVLPIDCNIWSFLSTFQSRTLKRTHLGICIEKGGLKYLVISKDKFACPQIRGLLCSETNI